MGKRAVHLLVQEQRGREWKTVYTGYDSQDFMYGLADWAFKYYAQFGKQSRKKLGKRVIRFILRSYTMREKKRFYKYRVCGEFALEIFMTGKQINDAIRNGLDPSGPLVEETA